MTIRVGLVGLGFGEKVLAPALRRTRSLRIVSAASAHPSKALETARRLGIPETASSWRRIVDDPRISAVVMALPPAVQYAAARRALSLGKPVFCEKPLAVTVRQARELARLAAAKRAVCAVDFELPQIDLWRRAKALLNEKVIGALREMQVVWNVETYAVRHDLASWKTDAAAGGGALNNFVSHCFHYIEHFAGPIRRLNCRLTRARGLKRIKGETGVGLWMETRQGVSVNAVVLTHAPGEAEHSLTFVGSRGKLVLRNRGKDYAANFELILETGDKIKIFSPVRRNEAARAKPAEAPGVDGRIEPVSRVMANWAEAVRLKKICRPGIIEGLRVQLLIEKARASHVSGRWVSGG